MQRTHPEGGAVDDSETYIEADSETYIEAIVALIQHLSV